MVECLLNINNIADFCCGLTLKICFRPSNRGTFSLLGSGAGEERSTQPWRPVPMRFSFGVEFILQCRSKLCRTRSCHFLKFSSRKHVKSFETNKLGTGEHGCNQILKATGQVFSDKKKQRKVPAFRGVSLRSFPGWMDFGHFVHGPRLRAWRTQKKHRCLKRVVSCGMILLSFVRNTKRENIRLIFFGWTVPHFPVTIFNPVYQSKTSTNFNPTKSTKNHHP